MISLELVESGTLMGSSKSTLFLPRELSGETLLVGDVNQISVAVDLSSGHFAIRNLEQVGDRRGIRIPHYQIFVVPEKRRPSPTVQQGQNPLGALILHEKKVAVLAHNPKEDSRHYVSIIGGVIDADERDAVAFLDWAICVLDENAQWHALYEYGQYAADWLDRHP